MERIEEKQQNVFLEDTGEKPSADYLAWIDREIQKGLDEADKYPEKMISHHEVRQEFGLEY